MERANSDILRIVWPSLGDQFVNRVAGRRPRFGLTVAYTATVQLPGLSGAGTTPELRELTAAADAEILAHGRARSLPGGVPSNPTGAPGPSIITRAAFDLLPSLEYLCLDAGLKHRADLPGIIRLDGADPAASLDSGHSLEPGQALRLFRAGLETGAALTHAAPDSYLILAESVPGGTTTALGVLLGLGLDAEQRVSSSMPDNAHAGKLAAVEAGLRAAQAHKGSFQAHPLEAVTALGDPMQPAVAGLTLAALTHCPVVLAGGTQMAAVIALLAALRQAPPPGSEPFFAQADFSQLALVTTRWVAADPTADLASLATEIGDRFGLPPVPYLAANLDFSRSQYAPMRLYEAGYVKEGVGAGGAAFAAMLALKLSAADLLGPIERVYERIVLGQ